jgi:cysteinyl-tRNA synthetase
MAEAHLGETIDIHGGGMDLQFPHHENEIAQSQCAHGGKIFARHWMHSGMLNLGGSKMSKSLGNTFHVHDLLRLVPAEALRYALLSGHYRQPLDWSETLIEQSQSTLNRLYGTLLDLEDVTVDERSVEIPKAIEIALDDDLDTVRALSELNGIASRLNVIRNTRTVAISLRAKLGRLSRVNAEATFRQIAIPQHNPFALQAWLDSQREMDEDAFDFFMSETSKLAEPLKVDLLGAGKALNLLQMNPADWFSSGERLEKAESELIDQLRMARREARAQKDYALSDQIRKVLADFGIEIKDLPDGTDQFTFHVKIQETIRFSDSVSTRLESLKQAIKLLKLE